MTNRILSVRKGMRYIKVFTYSKEMGKESLQRDYYECYHAFRVAGYLPAVSAHFANLAINNGEVFVDTLLEGLGEYFRRQVI